MNTFYNVRKSCIYNIRCSITSYLVDLGGILARCWVRDRGKGTLSKIMSVWKRHLSVRKFSRYDWWEMSSAPISESVRGIRQTLSWWSFIHRDMIEQTGEVTGPMWHRWNYPSWFLDRCQIFRIHFLPLYMFVLTQVFHLLLTFTQIHPFILIYVTLWMIL